MSYGYSGFGFRQDKITVIMPSYLGEYPTAASNREVKFRRAVESFLIQELGKLIIIADGCQKTLEIAAEYNSPSITTIVSWRRKTRQKKTGSKKSLSMI